MAAKIQVAGETQPTAQNPWGIQEYSLDQVASMPISKYLSIEGRIVNARSQVYYDTIRLESGTAWTSGQAVRLFTVGRDQPGSIANTGAAITKTNYDTNLIKNGTLESGTTAIVSSIEVRIVLNARLATADTSGLVSNPAPAAKTAATYSSTLLGETICNQTRLTYFDGEVPQENGLLWMFPTRYGYSPAYGGDAEEGVFQNVSPAGLIPVLDFPKVINAGDDFAVLIEPLAASLALPNDVAIRVLLVTKRIGAVR